MNTDALPENLELEVAPSEDGERLDRFLAARVGWVSRMHLRELLDRARVTVDKEPAAAGRRVRAGECVRIAGALAATTAMTPEAIPLRVYLEDDHLVVVEKPAGMVVHPAGRHRSGTLANALAHHFNVAGGAWPPVRPGIVHRLDKETSGLMVVAKTQPALSRLTIEFQQRGVGKAYRALVHGCPEPPAGEWLAPIGSDPDSRPRWGVRAEGRPATSRYRTLGSLPAHALLELEPITGRTNQLRLHAAHFGHPIAGDLLFGRAEDPGPGRLFLHAALLEFTHPATGERLRFESPLPEELAAYLEALRGPDWPGNPVEVAILAAEERACGSEIAAATCSTGPPRSGFR